MMRLWIGLHTGIEMPIRPKMLVRRITEHPCAQCCGGRADSESGVDRRDSVIMQRSTH
jgi:hypothetical protein